MRRLLASSALAAAVLLTLGASGSLAADSGAAFPVTIAHKYGSTTIESAPKRVVSIGFNDQDAILALGVVPVGVREWFGEKPDATWPWARKLLRGTHPTVLKSSELQMERIAALRPDLIVGVYSGITKKEYATLSRIAPTITQTSEYPDYGTPWQQATLTVGRALGKEQQAKKHVADVERSIAQTRRQVPALKGSTGLVAYSNGDGTYGVYTAIDPRARLLRALGMTVPKRITALGTDKFYVDFSGERINLVDVDMLLWAGGRDRVKDNDLYADLDVARQGRDYFLPDKTTMAGAMSFETVLSIPYFLKEMTPRMRALLDGNPATKPAPVE
jgi:iron complex transport system substrate-binding protein